MLTEPKIRAWLQHIPYFIPGDDVTSPSALTQAIWAAVKAPGRLVVQITDQGDAYRIEHKGDAVHVRGGETGILYGVQRYLMLQKLGGAALPLHSAPKYTLRMLNHWDNMDGSVERGYAGLSLFFRNHALQYDPAVLHRYGLMLSSVGINAVCLNNVNVKAPADELIGAFLPELSKVADILRLYGIRLLVAIEYAMPTTHGLSTADPLDGEVAAWWARKVDEIYQYIPDFCGFLVKADSEFRPGPYTYGRNHAEGANMLARALRPHGGTLVWRCFVYNCTQDWRDTVTDRPKAAYDHYAHLDGQFDDNVILQIKNGPFDFQVREPVSPLLMAMPGTRKALEVQLAQEYTGHQIDLFYMPPRWQEILSVLPNDQVDAICAVSNLGDSLNFAGHDLALANLYAYGRMAWQGIACAEEWAKEFASLTFGPTVADDISQLLLGSADTYERYTTPLGLCWMVTPGLHYGPSPLGYEFSKWGTYHRANFEAVGIDRSMKGTGITAQYPAPLSALYDDIGTCPEELLLFFHRVHYHYVMQDGRTLLQRLYDDHFAGALEAEALRDAWVALKDQVDENAFGRVMQRMDKQVKNAHEWRDVINTFFYRLTGIPDAKGRTIYP